MTPLAELAPEVAEVRELLGLCLYRAGQWKPAIVHLEAFREITATTEQNPVLADCYRALKDWDQVEELWEELRLVSPSAALVDEGRIVAAGARADRGDLVGAVRELEKGWRIPKRAKDHHLRRGYALADLYERTGTTARARELFGWVARTDADFADVALRLASLG